MNSAANLEVNNNSKEANIQLNDNPKVAAVRVFVRLSKSHCKLTFFLFYFALSETPSFFSVIQIRILMNIWSSERILLYLLGKVEKVSVEPNQQESNSKLGSGLMYLQLLRFFFVGTECNYGVGTASMISDLEGNVTAQSNVIRCRAEVFGRLGAIKRSRYFKLQIFSTAGSNRI